MKSHQNTANTPWGHLLQRNPFGKSCEDFTKGWPKWCSDLSQEQRDDVTSCMRRTRARLESGEAMGPHLVVGFGRQTAVIPYPIDAERHDQEVQSLVELTSKSDPDYVLLIACGWDNEARSAVQGGSTKASRDVFRSTAQQHYGVKFSLKTRKGSAHAMAALLKTQPGTRGYQFSPVKNWTNDTVASRIDLAMFTLAFRMCAD
jgi:hypothetical protein